MTSDIDIKYEALKVADVTAHAAGDLAVIVLDTNQGRIGLQALSREAPLPRHP